MERNYKEYERHKDNQEKSRAFCLDLFLYCLIKSQHLSVLFVTVFLPQQLYQQQ